MITEEEDFDIDSAVIEIVTEDYEKNDIHIISIDLSEAGIIEISYYDTRRQPEHVQSVNALRFAITTEDVAEGFVDIVAIARLMIRDAEIAIRDHVNANVGR